MWKRITDIGELYGVHATTVGGMEKLVKIQGSAAQISTADWASEEGIQTMATGIATEGGAVALVKGLAVFEADEDVYSYQDKQGRRWVELMNFKDTFPTLGKEVDRIKEKIFKKLKPELEKEWQKEYNQPLTQGTFQYLAMYGKTANKAIRMYFDEIEQFLKKTSSQGKMKNALRLQNAENSDVADWNENIITKFKIETVIFNKKRLTVRFKDVDQGGEYDASDVLAKLFPDQPVATDREPLGPFLEKMRKKVGVIQLVPQVDFEYRIEELLSTANMMNDRNR
jgi:hypothetical protein|tara:strand:+ start:40 stop:888 length:849 start_codon:yes stop_codon:yes gene_type:complete